jgi:hypothetical protein
MARPTNNNEQEIDEQVEAPPPRIATVEDFRPKGEPVTLPDCGLTVLLVRPDILGMIRNSDNGELPDPLTNMIYDALLAGKQKKPDEVTKEEFLASMDMITVIVKAAFLQPKVWDEEHPDEEHIPLKWLSINDRMTVFHWAWGEAVTGKIASFPQEPTGNLDTV